MSLVPSQGNSVLVDTPDSVQGMLEDLNEGNELSSWLVSRADRWKEFRERGYARRWAEYWRLWRGRWSPEDVNRSSERSRLIAPALSQAIEMSVSEIEEGLFSKDVFFDISDDLQDQEKIDAIRARDLLREDMVEQGVKDAVSECVLNGALFGTGIMKLGLDVRTYKTLQRNEDTGEVDVLEEERATVTYTPIRPDEFIPDPAGNNVGEMLGCFHEVTKPLHYVLERIEEGMYRRSALASIMPTTKPDNYEIDRDADEPQANLTTHDAEPVTILEYHGKVPVKMLAAAMETGPTSPLDILLAEDDGPRGEQGDGAYIEAIITIANNGTILRAIANPFVMKDRSIIAFQFEKVPGRFWGRGVAEKGFNPQKALDAEIRARIDALGYISAPMLGVDSSRLPQGFKMEVKPGKVWMTSGNPNEILQPIKIGTIDGSTFNQAQEMERMVQMGTGAFDTSSALNNQSSSGAAGASSNSAMMGAFVKRAKRSIRNVNDNLMKPLIKKSMWRYMEFAPERYPQDVKFNVQATLGIVQREVEAMQLTQLMGMMPEQFPQVSVVISKGIVELSSLHNKAEIMEAIDAAMQPPSEEEQQRQKELADLQYVSQKAQAQAALLENQKTMAETRKLLNEALVAARKADVEDEKMKQEQQRIMLQLQDLNESRNANMLDSRRLDLEQQRINIERQKVTQPDNN